MPFDGTSEKKEEKEIRFLQKNYYPNKKGIGIYATINSFFLKICSEGVKE